MDHYFRALVYGRILLSFESANSPIRFPNRDSSLKTKYYHQSFRLIFVYIRISQS